MRILDVAPRPVNPPQGGASVRTASLLRHLGVRHEVRQFSLDDGAPLALSSRSAEVDVAPGYVETTYSHPLGTALLALGPRSWGSVSVMAGPALRVSRPRRLEELARWADIVMVESPWQVAHCGRLVPDGRLVLATHRVERLRFLSYAGTAGFRFGRRHWLRYVERVEEAAVARSDLVVVVSDPDRLELVHGYGADPERVVVVPSGADTASCAPADPETRTSLRRDLGLGEERIVVYVATSTTANRAGLEWVRRLARASDRFTFLVVGPVCRPESSARLRATGRVPDVVPYLRAADLAICPIEHGGGTKIKLFESLAAGLPTVAFAASLHGTELLDGEHVLVAGRSEPELLAALGRLVDEAELAERLRAGGRAFVVAHHDWRDAADRLEIALTRLLGSHWPVPS